MYNNVVVLGVVLSILFTELTGLSPAGLIVPGYIALSLHSPLRVLYTLAIALIAMLVCRLLSKYVILYGRRRFALMILISFALNLLIDRLRLLPVSIDIIGYLVPGVIAREFDKQGIIKTILCLAIVTAMTVAVMALFGWKGIV